MYTFEYRFYPKCMEGPDIDEFDENMQWFISSLQKNGQILWDFQNTVRTDDGYNYRVVAPEKTGSTKMNTIFTNMSVIIVAWYQMINPKSGTDIHGTSSWIE